MSTSTTPSITLSNSEGSQTEKASGDKMRRSNGATNIGEGNTIPVKRKRIQSACTTCRQQKLRCDGSTKFPAPCSRCANHGLECRVDPKFKRTPAKQRLEQVSRQLEYMRERLELRPPNWQPAADYGGKATSTQAESSPEDQKSPTPIFPVLEPSLLPANIGDIKIMPDTIIELFHEFNLNYHPHLPIVSTTVSIETVFAESPLLFNTIIFIGSRNHPTYSSYYKRLIAPLNTSIADVSVNPNNSALDMNIQALLLLGSWPLHFEKQSEDGSWLRCGMATHLALQNGFHRPGFAQEFREKCFSRDDLRLRTLNWLACFLVDFSLSSKLGIPATIVPDFTVRNPPSDLPEKFKQHLQIASACSKFIPALSNNQFSATGLIEPASRWTLVQFFDSELEALQTQLSQANPSSLLPAESEILLLTNRLHIQTFVIHEDMQNIIGTAETSGVMIKAFRTAVKLIDVINSELKKDLLKFYPTYIVRSLVLAALWLIKLIAFSHARKSTRASEDLIEPYYATAPAAPLLDTQSIETAENHIRAAFTVLLKFSVADGDEPHRAAQFIEIIAGRRGDENPNSMAWGNSVRMRSRMGSSLYYDAIWEKKERDRISSTKASPQEDVAGTPGYVGSQQREANDEGKPLVIEPEGTLNWAESDAIPVDQGFWDMFGERDGFVSWDNSWDSIFSFSAPLDN